MEVTLLYNTMMQYITYKLILWMRFQVLRTTRMKLSVSWDVASCSYCVV